MFLLLEEENRSKRPVSPRHQGLLSFCKNLTVSFSTVRLTQIMLLFSTSCQPEKVLQVL